MLPTYKLGLGQLQFHYRSFVQFRVRQNEIWNELGLLTSENHLRMHLLVVAQSQEMGVPLEEILEILLPCTGSID